MRRNKKGSMELGVNAIVILIIALAILGLGIAFVTNLFRSGSDKLGSIIDNTELPIHADAVNPIAFEKSAIEIKQGKRVNLKISVYNDGFSNQNTPIGLSIADCTDSVGNDATSYFTLAAPTQRISPGSDSGYLAIITATPEAPVDSFVCTIMAEGDGQVSRQLIIDVIL